MNPIKKVLKFNAILWGSWLPVSTVALILQNPGAVSLPVILAISALLFVPAVVLSLLWWPICNQIRRNRLSDVVFAGTHIALGAIFVVLWLAMASGSAIVLFPEIVSLPIDWQGIFAWLFPIGILLYAIITGGYYWLLSPKVIVAGSTQKSTLHPAPKTQPVPHIQLNPRFIYEMLNFAHDSISGSPGTARKVLRTTIEMLQHAIRNKSTDTLALADEMTFVRHYLELEKLRLKDRFHFEENIDPNLLGYPIPAMMLQPLLENAIEHGIETAEDGGWIRLNINQQDQNVIAVVENSVTIAPSRRAERQMIQQDLSGLRNLQQRLALIYGKDVQFSAQSIPEEQLFRVKFYLPARPAARISETVSQ